MAIILTEPFDNLTAWSTNGSPTISSAQSYLSGNSLLINATGSAQYAIYNMADGKIIVGRFYYRIETDTSGSASIFQGNCTAGDLLLQARVGRKIRTIIGGTAGTDSAALNLNQWYRIDVLLDTSTGTAAVSYQIDGVAQTGQTKAQTSTNMTTLFIGNTATNTYKIYFDEYKQADTSATYPIGAATVSPAATQATGTGAANNAGKTLAAPAEITTAATGAAANAAGATSKSPNAENSAGTGVAPNASSTLGIPTQAASGSAAASDITTSEKPTPTVAAGTGAATDTGKTLLQPAGAATSTGAALNTTVSVGANATAGIATGTGAAANTTTVTDTTADPEAATATGTAPQPVASLSVPMGSAAGTGSALNASVPTGVEVAAVAAAGTGAATNSGGTVSASMAVASAVGAAGAGVIVVDDSVSPGIATSTGVALLAGPSVAVGPLAATGTGTAAFSISSELYLSSAQAGGTSAVYTPNVGVPVNASPSVAAGTGAAGQITPYVTLPAQVALGFEQPFETATDDFTRSASSGLGTAGSGQAWVIGGTASAYAVNGSAATFTHSVAAQSRRAWLPSVSAAHLEESFKFKGPAPDPLGYFDVWLSFRATAIVGDYRAAHVRVTHNGDVANIALSLMRRALGVETELATWGDQTLTFSADTFYSVRVRLLGKGMFAKVWRSDQSEPATWQVAAEDTQIVEPGGIGMLTYSPTGTYPMVFSWDDLVMDQLIGSQAYNAAPVQQELTYAIAVAALGTGSATDMSVTMSAPISAAAGTGTATVAAFDYQSTIGLASEGATGSASDAGNTVLTPAAQGTATAAAAGITTAVVLFPDVSEGICAAYDATASGVPHVNASADQSFGSGAVHSQWINLGAAASVGTATGSALGLTSAVAAGQTVAAATGIAINALVALVDDGVATPFTALGVGTAQSMGGTVVMNAVEGAAGSSAALNGAPSLSALAGAISSTGEAYALNPTLGSQVEHATATGSSLSITTNLTVVPAEGTGVGQAIDPGAGLDKQVGAQPAVGLGAVLAVGSTINDTTIEVLAATGAGVAYLPAVLRPVLGEYGQARSGGWPISQT